LGGAAGRLNTAVKLIVPNKTEAEAGLRAVVAVLTCQAPLNPIETRLLLAVQKYILRQSFDLEALAPIEPAELATAVASPALREQVINGMIVTSFASGDASSEQVARIEQFADALGVDQPALTNLRRLVQKRLAALRLDIIRHMYIGKELSRLWEDEGFKGLYRVVGTMRGWHEEPEVAARYRALGELPEGTLGRAYFDHCRSGGFPLPGERYATVERIAIHDVAHVLGGYGTDPEGEMQVAAFTAGFRREQGLYILLFVLCQFDLGVQMVPVAEPELGNLDPELFLRALTRGTNMNVDLFGDWDFWQVAEEPIEALRERYGITPAA